jgi:chromosome segregation ATPase
LLSTLQVNRRQAQADVVASEYAELQQAQSNLHNELLEAQHQLQMMQAEVRARDARVCVARTGT